MDVAEDAQESLDPRIQIELENLNNATDDINKLETELDVAHTAFSQLLSESTKRLKEIADKLGNTCIEKARYYFEALEVAQVAQVECQKQAQLYQRASEIHAAAKETVALAETRFSSHQHEWKFDQAWQDMLNHATIKVMDAENQKAECSREHHRKTVFFQEAEKKLLQLEEKYRRYIVKSRPYFEMKAQCDQMLATQKERVECLQKAIKEAKQNYASSLRILEEISNRIHQQRRDNDVLANGPREPGVGAELIASGNNSIDIDGKKDVEKIRNNECNEDVQIWNSNNMKQLAIQHVDAEHLSGRSVDGSEAFTNQWELEVQASMEKLNLTPFRSRQCESNGQTDINEKYNLIETVKSKTDDGRTTLKNSTISTSYKESSKGIIVPNDINTVEPTNSAANPQTKTEYFSENSVLENFNTKNSASFISRSDSKELTLSNKNVILTSNINEDVPPSFVKPNPICYSSNSSPLNSQRLKNKSSSIKELPLLSFIGIPRNLLQMHKQTKSSSMSNLNTKSTTQ